MLSRSHAPSLHLGGRLLFALAYVSAVTILVYVLEFTGQPFVPVFWYFFLPIIGWITYRSGLSHGLALAGLCYVAVAPIVISEFFGSGLSLEAVAQLSTIVLFAFAAFVSTYLVGLQRDLEARVEMVSAEREKTQRVIEAINDLVITTDFDCRLISANQSLLRMGIDPETNIGRPLCSVFSPHDENGEMACLHHCPVRKCISTKKPVSCAVRLTPENGPGVGIPVTWTAAPLFGDSSSANGVVSVIRDMSHDEELGRSKRDFITIVSHELRSPLANMGAALELIQNGRGSESRRGEMFSTVRSELARLGRFVEEILDAESIERGEIPVDREPVSLLPIVNTVVSAFAARDEARRFTVADAPDLPFVLADSPKTERVLHNLVQNAVNYSATGSPIHIDFSVHEDFVWVSVLDEGLGIPANRLGSIFDRFSRAHMQDSQDVYGYGLGLYTCKVLAEAQGGRIWAESEEGRGSRFTLALPVLEEAAP